MVSQRRSTQSRKGKEANPLTPVTNIPSSDILSSSQKDDEEYPSALPNYKTRIRKLGLRTLFYRRFLADILMAFKVLRAEVWEMVDKSWKERQGAIKSLLHALTGQDGLGGLRSHSLRKSLGSYSSIDKADGHSILRFAGEMYKLMY
ncbi:unnamed protein product [Cylicocyclus nassatus]|uniref:Uncharacterized protein n=1 Tax=Cylicocyclus nassatus TaxID=53992 RepID=A0AA36MA41_CYLNA|nr:unnamed protein product [Cylicocyclus nassatus]